MAELSKNSNKRRKSVYLERFLEEVRHFEFLYNKRSRGFKNTALKETVWEAIGKKFNMTTEEAERKFKVQRDRYNKEKKKQRESLINGKGVSDIYISNWDLYDFMDRLIGGCSNPNEGVINNLGFSEITDDSEVGIIDLQVKNESEAQTEIHSCVSSELNIEQEDSMEENNRCSTSCDRVLNSPQEEVNSTDKTPSITIESVFSQACKTSEATSSSTIKCKQEPQKTPDHIDQFCSYLNSRLHRIDKRDCHEVMRATEMFLLEKEGQEKYLSEM